MDGRGPPHSAWHGAWHRTSKEGSSGVDQQLTKSNSKTGFLMNIDGIRWRVREQWVRGSPQGPMTSHPFKVSGPSTAQNRSGGCVWELLALKL